MITKLLIIAAVVIASIGLRTFAHPLLRKLGALGFLAATYLVGYFATGSHVAGAAALSVWFLLPLVEILTRIRRLRLPLEKRLRHRSPPSARDFPQLAGMTRAIESEGFEFADDTGWEWEGLRQYYRLFYHPELKTQAAICLNQQHQLSFSYLAITSRVNDGRVYRTWNFPFSYTMKIAPEIRTRRVADAASFADLWQEHRAFLEQMAVETTDLETIDAEALDRQIELETQRQIEHNLDSGLIALTSESTFRYSWRGLFFLWRQFIKDMVKLS